jgi:hypothetical protein
MNWGYKKKNAVLLSDCTDVSIDIFIKCKYHNNLESLVVSGKPDENQLATQWGKIFEEYASLIEAEDYVTLKESLYEIYKLNAKLLVLKAALSIFQVQYSKPAADSVRAIGYNLKLNPDNHDEYIRDLNKIISHAKSLEMKIAIKVAEVEELEKKNKKGEDTEAGFMDGVSIISTYKGCVINIKQTTIYEYAAMQREYQKYVIRETTKRQWANK